jgi:hypothetical protein
MKMTFNRRFLVLAWAIASSIAATGCVVPFLAAGAAGAGAYAYLRGSIESHVDGSLEETANATRNTLNRMGCRKIKESSDSERSRFKYQDAFDTTITVRLQKTNGPYTRISIRVGTTGDEERSLKILQQIHENL